MVQKSYRTIEICAVQHEKWTNLNAFTVLNKLWNIELCSAWSFTRVLFSTLYQKTKKNIKKQAIFKINRYKINPNNEQLKWSQSILFVRKINELQSPSPYVLLFERMNLFKSFKFAFYISPFNWSFHTKADSFHQSPCYIPIFEDDQLIKLKSNHAVVLI
jgi:hypothetical protein